MLNGFIPILGSESFKEKILSTMDAMSIKSCSADFNRARNVSEIKLIIEHISSFYNIKPEVVVLPTKPCQDNWPKLVCTYICHKKFCHTLYAIAEALGYNRYESVSRAIRKCHSRFIRCPNLLNEINTLVACIKETLL